MILDPDAGPTATVCVLGLGISSLFGCMAETPPSNHVYWSLVSSALQDPHLPGDGRTSGRHGRCSACHRTRHEYII